jgi:hypothetical protein
MPPPRSIRTSTPGADPNLRGPVLEAVPAALLMASKSTNAAGYPGLACIRRQRPASSGRHGGWQSIPLHRAKRWRYDCRAAPRMPKLAVTSGSVHQQGKPGILRADAVATASRLPLDLPEINSMLLSLTNFGDFQETNMAKYCITAANHQNQSNHVASSFLVWLFDEQKETWSRLGGKSAKEVVSLIEAGHHVITGKFDAARKVISLGEQVEVEVRIAKNSSKYDISTMPAF